MLFKIYFLITLTCFALADKEWNYEAEHPNALSTQLQNAVQEEKSDFRTMRFLRSAMNFLPTKERPELNPVLSALINEDVRKSIEAKRAVEKDELKVVISEMGKERNDAKGFDKKGSETVETTDSNQLLLTTAAPRRNINLIDDMNVGFVEDTFNLDTAGSENHKKSRIEIKKGANGQEYEYEYAYYYEDEEDDSTKSKPADPALAQNSDGNLRGKSRYTSIDRDATSLPTENSLVDAKDKARSSNIANVEEVIEPERLPANTRFPSRDINNEVKPTQVIDSQYLAMEKRRISVKRPSLELVDSETFNTDEKQVKGSPRNGDTEANKTVPVIEEEPPTQSVVSSEKESNKNTGIVSESATTQATTPKLALELHVIMNQEESNNDLTTMSDQPATTNIPYTTNSEGGETLTTFIELSTTTAKTTSTTSITTETPKVTTTPTSGKVSLFNGKRPTKGSSRRHSFKPKLGAEVTTTTTSEPSTPLSQPKTGRNRFTRPNAGNRNRYSAKTTPVPSLSNEEEKKIENKEVKALNTGFGRNRGNRFNLRGSTTTEKAEDSGDNNQEAVVSSTTVRSLRTRPLLNLRGHSRPTQGSNLEDESSKTVNSDTDNKSSAEAVVPSKPTRFNMHRLGANRLPPRKFGRTSETKHSDDSAADSTNNNNLQTNEQQLNSLNKSEPEDKSTSTVPGRTRLSLYGKTENVKSKPTLPSRKINPLLAKRRLQLGSTTTEKSEEMESEDEVAEAKLSMNSTVDDKQSLNEDSTEDAITTTKQARGLGLLGQRKRLSARKPGTIL